MLLTMEFNKTKWNQCDYDELVEYLVSLSEGPNKKFSEKLIPGADNILGIRLPDLRKIAKQIAKGNYDDYLKLAKDTYHDEATLWGMVIGAVKCDFDQKLEYIKAFLPAITNWAICDSFCVGNKDFERNLDQGFKFLKPYLQSKNPWEIRFALIMFLAYYIKDQYIDEVLTLTQTVKDDSYYVMMGSAWLLSVSYVKFPEKTMQFFDNCSLDDVTFNKALQKIIESNRVTKEQKDEIRKLKRK